MSTHDEPRQRYPAQALSLGEFTQRVLVTVGIVALTAILWRVSDLLILTFASIILATLFLALSDPIARRTALSSGWALALTIAGILIVLILVGWLLGSRISSQFSQLSEALMDAWPRVQQWLGSIPFGGALTDAASTALNRGGAWMTRLSSFVSTTFGALANTVLILFIGIFLAANPELYRRGLLNLIPPHARGRSERALGAAGQALRYWLLGQMVSMSLVAVLTGLGLWLLDVPLALSLGVLAGLLEFVPFIGPIVAAIPGVLIAFTVGPSTALYAALLYLLIQQIEGNAIQPLVQRWAVALPPALALVAVIVFGLLFGILGVLFAIPLMVVVTVLVKKLYVQPLDSSAPGA